MKAYILRNFEIKDFEELSSLWLETDLGNPARGDHLDIILQSIDLGGALFILEGENKELIATAWITFDGRRLHLHHFGVKPKYQGKGYGSILTKHCIEFAKNKGYQIKLEVHKENTRAIHLYKKMGFNYLGDYDVYIIRNFDHL